MHCASQAKAPLWATQRHTIAKFLQQLRAIGICRTCPSWQGCVPHLEGALILHAIPDSLSGQNVPGLLTDCQHTSIRSSRWVSTGSTHDTMGITLRGKWDCCRPEAFAALREIEDAMRIIEKTESPMHFQGHCTFDNTFWEPDHEASSCPAPSRNS